MRILVCVKRVPITGGKMVLTADEQALETRHLGFTISPHEECGVEEAVRLVEANGGETVVLTLGPPEAERLNQHLRRLLGDDPALRVPSMAGRTGYLVTHAHLRTRERAQLEHRVRTRRTAERDPQVTTLHGDAERAHAVAVQDPRDVPLGAQPAGSRRPGPATGLSNENCL